MLLHAVQFHVVGLDMPGLHQSGTAAGGDKTAEAASLHAAAEQEAAVIQETPYHMVYFTESDQVVVFEDVTALHALTVASNSTTFFVGRRKHKDSKTSPTDYMGGLNSWRQCGSPGYAFEWPGDVVVHKKHDRRRHRLRL